MDKNKIQTIIEKHKEKLKTILNRIGAHTACEGLLMRNLADIGIDVCDFEKAYQILKEI